MKKSLVLSIAAIAVVAFTLGRFSMTPAVHAQQSAVTLDACTVNGFTIGPCSQYLVQIQPGRGFGRFSVFEVINSPVDPANLSQIGGGSAVSIQAFEPDPRGSQTFTLTASEP